MTVQELIEELTNLPPENKVRDVGFAYWTDEEDDLDSRLLVVDTGITVSIVRNTIVLKSRY